MRGKPLGPAVLETLREYCRWKKPRIYLFRSGDRHRRKDQPISDKSVWYACTEAARHAGITKRVAPHILRHSWATHFLEAGTDLRTTVRAFPDGPRPEQADAGRTRPWAGGQRDRTPVRRTASRQLCRYINAVS